MNKFPFKGKKNKAECAGFFVLPKITDCRPFYIDAIGQGLKNSFRKGFANDYYKNFIVFCINYRI